MKSIYNSIKNRKNILSLCSNLKQRFITSNLKFGFSNKLNQSNKLKVEEIPSFNDFIKQSHELNINTIDQSKYDETNHFDLIPITTKNSEELNQDGENKSNNQEVLKGKSFYLETFGCQMNVNDSEIIKSILNKNGLKESDTKENSDIIFFNTCSVRESAEEKVIEKVKHSRILKENNKNVILGILGCMAERKKDSLLELNEILKKQFSKINIIDLVAGPDSYKDLPRMLSALIKKESKFEINTQLSIEETYGDIIPVRVKNSIKAFVSIMRGCNNMCSFCIVPFTRGNERSRDLTSIYNEIKELSNQGIKEVTLLGQNVNSYFVSNEEDLNTYIDYLNNIKVKSNLNEQTLDKINNDIQLTPKLLSEGFSQMQKSSKENNLKGIRFTHLLFFLAEKFPDIQFRFTSPHPKDFPDQLISIIKHKHNICKSIHMPLQAGNTEVLASMKRFYTKESYINLVKRIRNQIPNVKISSDFIVGFCGETEDQFKDTLDVCKQVNFDTAYMFMYSMRPKTHAYYKLKDNVSQEEKSDRLNRLIDTIRDGQISRNKSDIGKYILVLVEDNAKKGKKENMLFGKSDGNITCVFENNQIPSVIINSSFAKESFLSVDSVNSFSSKKDNIYKGDWVIMRVDSVTANTLYCSPKYKLEKLSDLQYFRDC